MHDRDKAQEQNPERKEKIARKTKKLIELQQQVFSLRDAKTYTPEALELSTHFLNANSESYTIWNYRRELLLSIFEGKSDEEKSEIIKKELAFTESCIPNHPKSYWLWHHRRWLLSHTKIDQNELELCGKMLSVDPRNFHCWRHRQWVSQEAGERYDQKLEFINAKINENFSNYSAWHYRSSILRSLENKIPSEDIKSFENTFEKLTAEFELVKQAFYTEPEDQSSWLYHRWLVHCCNSLQLPKETNKDNNRRNKLVQLIRNELATCDELIGLEPDSKWPILTKVFLLLTLSGWNESDKSEISGLKDYLEKLKEIDSLRSAYYQDLVATIGTQ
eukprot:c22368_g1_i1.p1 GENE.c22368_g1_i1~~c22368_g1_i1.p1  ORF type:complete len:340 (-),score=113.75 c22368_g1_i1:28-1026(-)